MQKDRSRMSDYTQISSIPGCLSMHPPASPPHKQDRRLTLQKLRFPKMLQIGNLIAKHRCGEDEKKEPSQGRKAKLITLLPLYSLTAIAREEKTEISRKTQSVLCGIHLSP